MSGKHDSASAVVSIKPGAGGTDACDWAEILFRAYLRWPSGTASRSRTLTRSRTSRPDCSS